MDNWSPCLPKYVSLYVAKQIISSIVRDLKLTSIFLSTGYRIVCVCVSKLSTKVRPMCYKMTMDVWINADPTKAPS